jgi:tetratricopeptide (TPR) repeat protein
VKSVQGAKGVQSGTRYAGVCVLAALLAGGCAGSAPPPPSATERQAATLNQRAARAYEQGDYRRAAAFYEQALRIETSVENTEGIAANALSLARTWQAAGDAAAAHRALDGVLAPGPLPFSPPQRAQAQARKAQLYLDAGDTANAQRWSDEALASCTGCAALPAIQTLRGRVALAATDYATALDWGGKALAAAGPGPGQERERANALRLIGVARIGRGEPQAALAPLEQALELDRGLGLADRIAMDLMALGQARLKLGDRAQAKDYFSRAKNVSVASGDAAGVRAAERALEGR